MREIIPVQYNISTDKEIAQTAHDLILSDFKVYETVEEIADAIGTSAYKLRNAFTRTYCVSLFFFSRAKRLEESKKLLTETNYTLQTIAEMVGFEEGNNFQTSFKTVVGVTLGAFRQAQLKSEG